MRLVSFRVRDYKNFVDSEQVEADSEVTVLVGKNEAGKTTLLDALWRLRPANTPPRDFNLTEDYPRWLKKDHEIDGTIGEESPIAATFALEPDEITELARRFGQGIVTSQVTSEGAPVPSFTALRVYNDDDLKIEVDVDPLAWVRAFTANRPLIWSAGSTVDSVEQMVADLKAFESAINAEDDPTAEGVVARQKAFDATKSVMTSTPTTESLKERVESWLAGKVPKFFYFDDVYLLPGKVSIADVTNAVQTGDESGLGEAQIAAARFLRSVHLDPENLKPENYEALKAELEAISNALTDRVQKFWRQNPNLDFQVAAETVEGPNPHGGQPIVTDRLLNFRVYDKRHRASTAFTSRSTGFRWFVSFLAQFAFYAEDKKDVIVLLDEPGVALHAKAQNDLLGYIDAQLVPKQQVLYTTHSAWMVPVRKIQRVRTVEEDLKPHVITGASVSGKMLAKDRDTLMPLQAALGYDIAQSLFIGPDSLVVEGISEVLYLYDMSDLLLAEGRTGLDPRWHVCPAGSVSRIPAMLSLLGNSIDTTVLIDSPANPQEKDTILERMYDDTRLIEIAQITGDKEGDIEDLIAPADYLRAYNLQFASTLVASKLKSPKGRIVKRIEHTAGSAFNHADVARTWVRERAKGTLAVSDETKNRFEKLFTMINATLDGPAPQATGENPALAIFRAQRDGGTITAEQFEEYAKHLSN